MPVLEPGVPFSSPDPILRVENRLRPGSYQFQLVCVDEGGNESDPAPITVTVSRPVIVDPDPPVFEPADPFEPRRPRGPFTRPRDPRVFEPVDVIEPRRPAGPVIRGGGRILRPPGR